MMKNGKFLLILVILVTLIPSLFFCKQSIDSFSPFLDAGKIAEHFDYLASNVEADNYTKEELVVLFRSMAGAERKIEGGVRLIIQGYYLWAISFILLALMQIYLLKLFISKSKINT